MVFDPTCCAVTISQPYEMKALPCLACCLPASSSEAAPLGLRGEELCPQVLYQILPFSTFKKRFFSLFHVPPQISLTMHILDRKCMLTSSKIEHCGIKINYRDVETLMEAFWSSRLFLCNAECVIKHHFP